MSKKDAGGVLTVALTAMALNGHLIAKLVQLGVMSLEDADEIFVKTAELIERPLGALKDEDPKAAKIMRQFAHSIREMSKL